MNKYVLIGIPSSGKSTIGKRAADVLQIPFYNTDEMAHDRVDPRYRNRLLSFTRADMFVDEQRAVMAELAELDTPAIVEVWPEAALRASGAALMKEIGTIIYIKRDTEAALKEVEKKQDRLILCEVNNGFKIDMRAEAVKGYAAECPRYEALADLTLDNNGSVDEAVEKLVTIIRGCQK